MLWPSEEESVGADPSMPDTPDKWDQALKLLCSMLSEQDPDIFVTADVDAWILAAHVVQRQGGRQAYS